MVLDTLVKISAEAAEMYPHLLCTYPALFQRRKDYLSVYYMDDLEEPLGIDIGSLNRYSRSSEWFWD